MRKSPFVIVPFSRQPILILMRKSPFVIVPFFRQSILIL